MTQMLFSNHTTYVGIDPTAGQRPFAYAAIDQDRRLLALGHGEMEDVLAFAAGQREAYIAVSAPRRPNQGVLARREVRRELSPMPRSGRWVDFRLAEYLLRQHNIHVPQTSNKEESCPNWMQSGFQLHRRLEALGYQAYPADEALRQSLEVYPHACFAVLLGQEPFPKYSLEGRLQRQLALFEQKINVPDPMRFFEEITSHRLLRGILPLENLYSSGELDALVGAYTAWLAAHHPSQVCLLGDAQEGQIVLPVGELKEKY